MIQVTKDIRLGEREVKQRFVRAMGPGGQNVRNEATAVELRLDIGASSLPPDVKERLLVLGGGAVTNSGVLVVTSRAHRSQIENREDARARLVTLLLQASQPPKKRRATQPRRTVRQERLQAKRLRGAVKHSRSQSTDD